MSTIDASTQLAAMIRAQIGAQIRARARQRGGSVAGAARSAGGMPQEAGDPQGADTREASLEQLVALRVSALSPDDPQRGRKAFRLFLESVLVQALGRDRLDAHGFDQLVDAVLERMESDPELHAALHQAGDLLLADANPDPARRT